MLDENIDNVKEFSIEQESFFKKFRVLLERSQTTTLSQAKDKNPKWKEEIVFLKAIVTGNANLYVYYDGNLTKFFFETKEVPIEQLVMIEYFDNEKLARNNLFRQQLFNHVKCEKMATSVFENLSYTLNALSAHFIAYNECTSEKKEPTVDYQSFDKKRKKQNIRLIAGVYNTTLSLDDGYIIYDGSVTIKNPIVKVGLDAEFFLPFNKNSWSIFINPMYGKYTIDKNYEGLINNPGFVENGTYINYDVKTSFSQLDVPIGLRYYKYINSSSKIFFNAAYVIGFIVSDSEIKITNNNNLVNADATLTVENTKGLAVGLGFSYKKLSAELRYDTARDLTATPLWKAKYGAVGVNFGYILF